MQRLVAFAREHDVVLVHDFAYADIGFDGYKPPSILQVPGAKDVAVELYTLTKSFSMAGWRVGFLVGNAEIVQALTKLKSYLDYGTFQPIQIAAIVAMNEAPDYPQGDQRDLPLRRDALVRRPNRIGWEVEPPKGTMFVWAPIPEPYREMGSLEFSKLLVREAKVATSPGSASAPAATATCASPSSRTSNAPARPCVTCAGPSPSSAEPALKEVPAPGSSTRADTMWPRLRPATSGGSDEGPVMQNSVRRSCAAEHAGKHGSSVWTRSTISPPSATRTHSGAPALATQIQPSASRQQPSGATPSSLAQTRRPERLPSSAMSKAASAAEGLPDQQGTAGEDHGAVGEGQVRRRL